jgi:hypothetical protein
MSRNLPPAEAVVLDAEVASRSFRGRARRGWLLAWRVKPILSFVTVGELAQWTRLRHCSISASVPTCCCPFNYLFAGPLA